MVDGGSVCPDRMADIHHGCAKGNRNSYGLSGLRLEAGNREDRGRFAIVVESGICWSSLIGF